MKWTGEVFWQVDVGRLADKKNVVISATPVVIRADQGTTAQRTILIGTGVGANATGTKLARLYCFQDETRHAP